MKSYKIVLADDHTLFRHGIRRIIEDVKDLRIVGEAKDGLELLDLLKTVSPDLVILDISMPRLRGIEACKEILTMHPSVKVLILTMHRDTRYFHHAVSAGADGYLLKEDADSEMLSAITTIRDGRRYISPLLANHLTGDLLKVYQDSNSFPREKLTGREKEVLKLIAEGKTSKEIAELLYISFRTVQHHRSNIMTKLNIRKSAELIKYAIFRGYTSEG